MRVPRLLFLLILLTLLFSCKTKRKDDRIVNVGLDYTYLRNKEAENDFNKGLYYIRQENYSAAEEFFLQADKESPNTPMILNSIANCKVKLGQVKEGLPYYKRAIEIDSNFTRTYIGYGRSLNYLDSFDEAEKILRLGLARQRMSSFERGCLYLNLSDTYSNRHQIDYALSLLDSAKMGHISGKLYNTILKAEADIKQKNHFPRQR